MDSEHLIEVVIVIGVPCVHLHGGIVILKSLVHFFNFIFLFSLDLFLFLYCLLAYNLGLLYIFFFLLYNWYLMGLLFKESLTRFLKIAGLFLFFFFWFE